jgi:hypothetical protein
MQKHATIETREPGSTGRKTECRSHLMERYIFFAADTIPPTLPVIGVPMPDGFVWVELTPAEYEAAVADLNVARHLVAHARDVLATRLLPGSVHASMTRTNAKESGGREADATESEDAHAHD